MARLADMVSVARRYQRAVRIDSDCGSVESLDGLISTESSNDVLLTMCQHIESGRQGAFTWTGPYGSGKSTLAVGLAALISGDSHLRAASAECFDKEIVEGVGQAFSLPKRRWRIAAVVGSKVDPTNAIGQALEACGDGSWTEATLLEALANQSDTDGLLLMVDEMGKFLEGATQGIGDIHVFQQIAELASRMNGRLVFVGVLHQAFAEYANRLDREKRDEWTKIQGRFVDLPVNVAGEEQLAVLSRALVTKSQPKSFATTAKHYADVVQGAVAGASKGMSATLAKTWPLHPIVALLLGPISQRRFGQNQRSIFGFLNSAEPEGFRQFIEHAKSNDLYYPWRLWDYLEGNLEPSIMASPDGHRWAIAAEALSRCSAIGASEEEVKLLKTIALIDLFKGRSGLSASMNVLEQAGVTQDRPQLETLIDRLESWSLIVNRRFQNAYAIFAGSDFDLELAVANELSDQGSLDLTKLRTTSNLHSILAKRHYHETGALRWFGVSLCSIEALSTGDLRDVIAEGSMGTFILAVPLRESDRKNAKDVCSKFEWENADHDVVVGTSKQCWDAVKYAQELLALQTVAESHPELANDPVARREVHARSIELATRVEAELAAAIGTAEWYWEDHPPRRLLGEELNGFASEIADRRFPATPRIDNELLNRTSPSSNAVAAQNALLRRMALGENQARLGIDGYPAEGGLYRSLLEKTGLHREEGGRWKIGSPNPDDDPCNLTPLWEAARTHLRENADRTVRIAELYEIWAQRPIGLKEGLMPLIAVAFTLSQRDTVAFYRNGIFQSRFQDLDVEVLAKDPNDIQLRWMNLDASAKKTLSGMAEIVRDLDQKNELTDLQPIDVARGLMSVFDALPAWTVRTGRLSNETAAVRNLFKKANDPNRLLFDDLPRLMNGESDGGRTEVTARLRVALEELTVAYPAMLSRLRTLLMAELSVPNESPASLRELQNRAENVKQLAGDYQIEAFVSRLSNFTDDQAEIEGLISLAVSKPPSLWSDNDIDSAAIQLAEFAQNFNRLEAFSRVKGRKDNRHAVALVIGLNGTPQPLSLEFEVTESDRIQIEKTTKSLRTWIDQNDLRFDKVLLASLAELSACVMRTEDEQIEEQV